MKVELDCRPATNNDPNPFFAIRLYPENNKDMTNMKWGLQVMGGVNSISEAGLTDEFHYVITFQGRKKT